MKRSVYHCLVAFVLAAGTLCACTQANTPAPVTKRFLTKEEIILSLAPKEAIRPLSSPWGAALARTDEALFLAAALHGENALGVWEILPDRGVREAGIVPVGYHPDSVADMGGGVVAVAVEGDTKVSFWGLTKDGLPKFISEIKTPFPARQIETADLDGDGQRDLVLAPYSGSKVAVLWGKGGLEFGPPLMLEAAPVPWYPRIVDWNLDGLLDLVWSDWDTGSARLYLNKGERRFELRILQGPEGSNPRQLAVGDVDRDGRPDAVLALSTGKAARILYNRGQDTPEAEEIPGTDRGYVSAAVLEDGTILLGEEQRIFIARKLDGAWAFRTLPAGSFPSEIYVSDIDSDGYEDMLVLHSSGGGMLITYGPLWEAAKPFEMPAENR